MEVRLKSSTGIYVFADGWSRTRDGWSQVFMEFLVAHAYVQNKE